MNDPLKWEKVPCEGTDLGLETYRALIDGQGWLVVTVLPNPGTHAKVALGVSELMDNRRISSTFVPDPNGMWGKES